jgi:hypothetical protein
LDFGADRTQTTDSTAAFQAALTQANSSSLAVYVPAGNYKLSNTLTIGTVRLFGDGNSILVWTGAFDGTGISITGQATIDNLYIWKANTGTAPTNSIAIDVTVAKTILSNLDIRGVGTGLNGWKTCVRYALYIHSMTNCKLNGYNYGVYADKVNNLSIDQSVVDADQTACVFLAGGAGNSITNSDIEGSAAKCIHVYGTGSYDVRALYIAGNYIESSRASAYNIYIQGNSANLNKGIQISGNYLNLIGGGVSASNILVDNTDSISILSNCGFGSDTASVVFNNTTSNVTIQSNTFDLPTQINGTFTNQTLATVVGHKPITTAVRNALTAEKGMVIYNFDTNKLQVYNGAWVDLH